MYLIVNPDGVLQEPILLFLHPVCLKLLLADFTQLQRGAREKDFRPPDSGHHILTSGKYFLWMDSYLKHFWCKN